MKTLVVFYSLGGNTKHISGVIAKELHADLLELKPKKEYPSSGFMKYFWGGKSVVFKEQPELTNTNIDLKPYENIVIGTPIWAGSYAAPYNTFVQQYKFTGKKVALFACHAGGGTEKCFKMFKDALPDNQFMGEIDFNHKQGCDKEEIDKRAVQWARGLNF